MTTQIEHTPTPWYASDDGAGYSDIFSESTAVEDIFVAKIDASDAQTQANVTYIVKAANLAPQLAEALQQFIGQLTTAENMGADVKRYFSVGLIERTREALEAWNEDE